MKADNTFLSRVELETEDLVLFGVVSPLDGKPYWTLSIDNLDSAITVKAYDGKAVTKLKKLQREVNKMVKFFDDENKKANDKKRKANDVKAK